MPNKINKLQRIIGNGLVLFSCEGVAEGVIVTKLIEHDLTFLDRAQIVQDDSADEDETDVHWFTNERHERRIEDAFLNEDYGNDVFVLSVKDQQKHGLKFRETYTTRLHPVHAINIITHPEIEMLVLYREGQDQQFRKWYERNKRSLGKNAKPSKFCTTELRMADVKEYSFLKPYWDDETELVGALNAYRQHTVNEPGDFMLADLLK
ncbi:hypothetical protein [Bifidobacterium sp. ESL0745]|uniref:hypothetical protein n=1 Tax=Bifidobacterium sp. ESL0745 TaxID=2983226 RepID=UPI0023F7BAB4|nr:hypothetical protein [Bifidobacterium sp. ESL0745]MDF7664663.1 hypothetical protein [Bifidobacterium sp. ESL0745]